MQDVGSAVGPVPETKSPHVHSHLHSSSVQEDAEPTTQHQDEEEGITGSDTATLRPHSEQQPSLQQQCKEQQVCFDISGCRSIELMQ